ncbi:hypothetical protein AK812_SmicGene16165 [Symbiodinium microadriaticum]|uniref:Uncharacterized protein n=1 Tax=Symbiodinium microadriaticum TaxID=2951 RepID=A0A1Q9E156_SYMMI|nr:hypothetical protein AK812_SmicGene16165 [Symbiodinium microadriaticum]
MFFYHLWCGAWRSAADIVFGSGTGYPVPPLSAFLDEKILDEFIQCDGSGSPCQCHGVTTYSAKHGFDILLDLPKTVLQSYSDCGLASKAVRGAAQHTAMDKDWFPRTGAAVHGFPVSRRQGVEARAQLARQKHKGHGSVNFAVDVAAQGGLQVLIVPAECNAGTVFY